MKELTCIVCPNGCSLTIDKDENGEWIVCGNMCPRGKKFAISEVTNPLRSLCSTVKTDYNEFPRLPVRTNGEIPRSKIKEVMDEINKVEIHELVHRGDVVIKNVLNTGIDIIATSDMTEII